MEPSFFNLHLHVYLLHTLNLQVLYVQIFEILYFFRNKIFHKSRHEEGIDCLGLIPSPQDQLRITKSKDGALKTNMIKTISHQLLSNILSNAEMQFNPNYSNPKVLSEKQISLIIDKYFKYNPVEVI